jgi:hypothetical protein
MKCGVFVYFRSLHTVKRTVTCMGVSIAVPDTEVIVFRLSPVGAGALTANFYTTCPWFAVRANIPSGGITHLPPSPCAA